MVMSVAQESPHHRGGDAYCFTSASSSCISQEVSFCVSANSQTQVSTFSEGSFSTGIAGSESSDDGSFDVVGHMLKRLDDNDASLKELFVDCKSMDNEAAAHVERVLPKNTCVQKLILHCGTSSGHRQIFHKVLSGLKENSYIDSLAIQGAEIDSEVASWLLPFLAHSRKLKRISMMSCKGSALEGLVFAMQYNNHVRHLTFSSCFWEEYIADIVSSSLPSMELCSLSLVDITIAVDGWPYLFRNIRDCKELTELDLSRNDLDASSINLLTKCLTTQQQISKLSLSSCGLDYQCMKELAKGLVNYSKITSLDISHNKQLDEKGMIFMNNLLLFNDSITELKVDGCGLNKQSINEIERGLRYNNCSLKCFFSFAMFGFIEKMITPQHVKSEENIAEAEPQPAAVDNPSIVDEQDADETIVTEFAQYGKSLGHNFVDQF